MRKLVIALLSMLFAASGFASVWPVQNTAIWSNPAHWNTGVLPATSDAIIINTGRNLVADTNATIVSLNAPNAANHTATLTLTNNIILQVTTWARIGYPTYNNNASTMNHSAGTFNVGGELYIAAGSGGSATYNQSGNSTVDATGTLYILARSGGTTTYNLSGGELTGTTLDVGKTSDSLTTGTTTFNQTGGTVSSATVKIAGRADVHYTITGGQMAVTDLTVGDGTTPAESFFEIGPNATGISIADDLVVGPRGNLMFNLSTNGATPIAVADLFDVISGSAKIFVDAALYTGGATNIELITFASIGTAFSRQAIMNMPSGLTGSLVYTANSLSLDIALDISVASVSNLTLLANNIVSMDVSATDPEISTIKTTTNLAGGTWQSASYSTNSGGPFAIGALTDPEMTVYVQATNQTSFFKVGDN